MRSELRRKMRERKRAERFAKTHFNFAFANLSKKVYPEAEIRHFSRRPSADAGVHQGQKQAFRTPQNLKEELIMTNYEEIKTMDKDELAEFLSSIMDGQKCPASEKFCDGQRCCVDAILNWLNADLDDEPGETSDMIHHPDHYTWKGTECKKVIELMTRGLSGAEAYYMGNIIKYLYRYPKKGTLGTDLAKAAQYMEFLKKYFEKKEESGHAE